MRTIPSVQAGAKLLAAAVRDPAAIVHLSTFWDFMKIIEACGNHLTDAEKASPLYLEHVVCYDRIYQMRTDIIPVGDDQLQLGEHFTEALAAFADQAADLLPLLLDQRAPASLASFFQAYEQILSTVAQEIEKMPGGPAVQLALTAFEQSQCVTTKEGNQADALYEQAMDLFDQKRYAECLPLLNQVLRLEPDRAHIYYSRGNARSAMKDFRGAVAEYLWALRCAPYYVSAFNNLGNTYEAMGQYEKSSAQYQQALQIEPENATLHYNLAGAYHGLGRLPEALAALNTAIELDPAFADCHFNRANTLSRLGRHEEALAGYRQALALKPDDSNIAWTATWAQFGSEDLSDAQAVELERIAGLDPLHYTSHCCLAVLALHHSDPQAALRHLEQSVALSPKDWDPHFWVGLVAAKTGELEVARHAIERSLELGLPPLLLAPLGWLKATRPDFFEGYARGLLQRFEISG